MLSTSFSSTANRRVCSNSSFSSFSRSSVASPVSFFSACCRCTFSPITSETRRAPTCRVSYATAARAVVSSCSWLSSQNCLQSSEGKYSFCAFVTRLFLQCTM